MAALRAWNGLFLGLFGEFENPINQTVAASDGKLETGDRLLLFRETLVKGDHGLGKRLLNGGNDLLDWWNFR